MVILQNTSFADENQSVSSSVTLSCHVETGYMYGSITESAYENGKRISKLDWDIKNLFFAGGGIGFKLFDFIDISLDIRQSLNEKAGSIKDSDYDLTTGTRTRYSRHSCHLKRALIINPAAGIIFQPLESLNLMPFIDLHYMNYSFEARDGYLEYPPGSVKNNVYGTGIIFSQRYLFPAAGIGVQYKINSKISIGIQYEMSPFLQCESRDSHIRRGKDFYDSMKNGMFYSCGMNLSITVLPDLYLVITPEFCLIPDVRGSSISVNQADGIESVMRNDGAGTGMKYFVIVVSLKKQVLTL